MDPLFDYNVIEGNNIPYDWTKSQVNFWLVFLFSSVPFLILLIIKLSVYNVQQVLNTMSTPFLL